MDIVTGLAYTGKYIGDKAPPPKELKHNNKVKRSNINGANIYQSRNLGINRRFIRNKANVRYRKSDRPMETGIVPNFYNQVKVVEKEKREAVRRGMLKERLNKKKFIEPFNSQQRIGGGFDRDMDSVFSDENSYGSMALNSCASGDSVARNHMAFFNRSDKIRANKIYENKHAIQHRESGFLRQFEEPAFDNPRDPVSSNNVHHNMGNRSKRIEMERDMALRGEYSKFTKENDMTYGIVGGENFMHNNMVPYFKRGLGKGYGPGSVMQKKLNSIHQRKLDTFSGSVKNIEYRPKTERRPLFNPHVGLTHIYGMPNFTDYFETRYIPGRERRNEKPFQEVRITPGLNLGYNEISKEGFHNTWRALPKTVDELRVANNPKISYGKPVIHGMKGTRRPISVPVHKRRPVRFREYDPRDLQTQKGGSYYKAPAIYGNFNAPHTNRQQTSKAWGGPAKFVNEAVHLPQSMYKRVKISHKENFAAPMPRNITGVDRSKNTSYTADTYYAKPTERMTTQNRTWVNPAGPEYARGHAFDMVSNIPDPTIRNQTEKRTWFNPAHAEWKKHHAFDMTSNIPDPTLRNITEKKTYQSMANAHERKRGGYHVAHPGTIAKPTMRQTTQNTTYYAPLNKTEYNKGSYQVVHQNTIAPTTIRQTTQKKTHYNPLGHTTFNKGGYQVAVQNTIAPTTIRQLTQKKTHFNPLGHTSFDKGGYQVAVQNTIAPTTIRQLTQKKTHYNPLGKTELNKGGYQAEHFGVIAKPTMRQITQKTTHYNPLGKTELDKGGYQVAHQNTIAPTTMRQTTQKTTYYRPLGKTELDRGGYQVAHQNTIAPTTMRQTTQKTTHYNPLGKTEFDKGGYQVAHQNTIAPTTMRQTTQNTTHYNPFSLSG